MDPGDSSHQKLIYAAGHINQLSEANSYFHYQSSKYLDYFYDEVINYLVNKMQKCKNSSH